MSQVILFLLIYLFSIHLPLKIIYLFLLISYYSEKILLLHQKF